MELSSTWATPGVFLLWNVSRKTFVVGSIAEFKEFCLYPPG